MTNLRLVLLATTALTAMQFAASSSHAQTAPLVMAQAAAPLLFGLLIDIMGSRVLIVSSALSLSALLALALLRTKPAA